MAKHKDIEIQPQIVELANCAGPNKEWVERFIPRSVTTLGTHKILSNRTLAFFCSIRCPGEIIIRTYDLARALRNTDMTIIGGFQTPMEKEYLALLLRGTAPVVVCPARGLGRMRVRAEWKQPLADGRLLFLSFFDDGIRRATAKLAARRNEYVAALADRILVAHAGKGSKTEGFCRDALASGKPVFTLDSPDNAHLVEIGAVPVRAEDPAPLVAEALGTAG